MPTRTRKTAEPKAKRQRRTPEQRAAADLAVSDREVKRLTTARDKVQDELVAVRAQLDAAIALRDYRAQSPFLPNGQHPVEAPGAVE